MSTKKPPDQVRRRNTKILSVLPPEGREGPPPAWPIGNPSQAELDRWAAEWAKPQALVWEQWRCETLVARYVRAALHAERPDASPRTLSEVRLMEGRLGLDPKGIFDLQWTLNQQLAGVDDGTLSDLAAYRQALEGQR